jgi:hypothetical protein
MATLALKLPLDNLWMVVEYLWARDLSQLRGVCVEWRELFSQEHVWAKATVLTTDLARLVDPGAAWARERIRRVSPETMMSELNQWLWVLTQLPSLEAVDCQLTIDLHSVWLKHVRPLLHLRRLHWKHAQSLWITGADNLVMQFMPGIRQLCISNVLLVDHDLAQLALSCPLIEELHLKALFLDQTVCMPSLTLLVVEGQFSAQPTVRLGGCFPRLERLTVGSCSDYGPRLVAELPNLVKLSLKSTTPFPAPQVSQEWLSHPLRMLCVTQPLLHMVSALSWVRQVVVLHMQLIDERDDNTSMYLDRLVSMMLAQVRLQHLRLRGPVPLVEGLLRRLAHQWHADSFSLVSLKLVVAPGWNTLVPVLLSGLCCETLEELEVDFEARGGGDVVEVTRSRKKLLALKRLSVVVDRWGSSAAQVAELMQLAALCPVDRAVAVHVYGPAVMGEVKVSRLFPVSRWRVKVCGATQMRYRVLPGSNMDWLYSSWCVDCHWHMVAGVGEDEGDGVGGGEVGEGFGGGEVGEGFGGGEVGEGEEYWMLEDPLPVLEG